MLKEIDLHYNCPHCNKMVDLTAPVNPLQAAPDTIGEIPPISNIFVYRISSDQIRQFIIKKAKTAVSDIKIEVVPVYTEKRRRNPNEPHRSYASLRIGFSEAGLDKKDFDKGWFSRVGQTSTNMKFVKSIFDEIVKDYKYNRKEVEKWLESYKNMERLEEMLGITEKFVNELLQYCTPQRIVANNGESWVIFAAAAENVIADMLSDPDSKAVTGRIQIQDVYQLSKDKVEFIVYVHSSEMKMQEDPQVRRIMTGEEKPKK